jgi:thioredoxin
MPSPSFSLTTMDIQQFQEILSTPGARFVVDFWAPWCGPCRMTKPVLEKLALEYAGQVTFLPLNADESRTVLEHYHVMSIPTVLALRDGKQVARVTGAQSEAQYRAMFAALAAGEAVRVSMAPFDRYLRLGAGLALAGIGIAYGSWLALAAGGVVAFLGFYDRCPVWAALTGWLRKKAEKSS